MTPPSKPPAPKGGAKPRDQTRNPPRERPRKQSIALDEQIERAESEGMVTEQAKVSKVDPDHGKGPPQGR